MHAIRRVVQQLSIACDALPSLMLHQIVVAAKSALQAGQGPTSAAWAATQSAAARSEAAAAAGHSGNDRRGSGEPVGQSAGETTGPDLTAAGSTDAATAAGPSGISRESAEPARQPAGMQARAAGRTVDGNAEPASQTTGRSPHPSIPQRTWKKFAKAEKSRVAEYKGVRWGSMCSLHDGRAGTWGISAGRAELFSASTVSPRESTRWCAVIALGDSQYLLPASASLLAKVLQTRGALWCAQMPLVKLRVPT